MTFYTLLCQFTPEQKQLILKNPHTLHFFCYYDNIKVLSIKHNIFDQKLNHELDEEYDITNGYIYKRHFTNKFPTSFNINYDLIKNIYFQNSIRFKLDDNFPSLTYQDRRQRPTSTLHLGQIKLFLTILQFLTKYIPKNKETHIVYPGSAYGQNIHILSKLFPNCYWYLIDPNNFYVKLHDNNKILYMSNTFFTNENAHYFKKKLKNKFTVFICDTRNLDTFDNRDLKEFKYDKDMYYQYNWCKIFNADISFLKFRIPRFPNEYTYFDGELFIQPFAPVTTNETRLVVKKNAKDKIYYLNDYEDKLYYHNRILRVCNYSKLHNYKYKYFCNCFDCTSFFLILENYIKIYNSDLSIYPLIEKIFKYLHEYKPLLKDNFNKIIENIK
jgi:hypothetical protein